MGKKVLSFIHGEQVRVAPGTRVIPAETFSLLTDAEDILAKVKDDARRFREENVAEAEREKEQARQEGFAAGMQAWADQLMFLENEIKRVHDEMQKLVVSMATKAAQKIVSGELETNKKTIIDIVKNVLKKVTSHQVITVHCNPEDAEILTDKKSELRELFERLDSLAIAPSPEIQRGGCVIETESGIINAEIEHQWDRLQQALSTAMRAGLSSGKQVADLEEEEDDKDE